MRWQERRPALHPKCAPMGDIGYSEPKKLLRDDISKSWTRAKEVSSMQKQFEFDPTK